MRTFRTDEAWSHLYSLMEGLSVAYQAVGAPLRKQIMAPNDDGKRNFFEFHQLMIKAAFEDEKKTLKAIEKKRWKDFVCSPAQKVMLRLA